MRLKNSEVEKSKSYFTIVSETYKDFAENTSIHGLKYTAKPEIGLCEKIFWALVVILGLCGAVYMTILFWERYSSNPTRTTVYTAYAPTILIPFPAVTICNLNSIMESKVETFLKKLDYNNNTESLIRSAIYQLSSFSGAANINATELNILQSVLEQNEYFDVSMVMDEISQNCTDMLIYCVWNTKKVSCMDTFDQSFSHNGICCSFNYLSKKQNVKVYSRYSGLGTGLRVLLNSQREEMSNYSIHSAGFKVILHYPTEYPGVQSDSRMSTVGRVTYLQILGTKLKCGEGVKNLPITQRQCLFQDEFRMKYFGNKYSGANCLIECEEDLYVKLCGCVPYYFSFSDKPTCNISMIPCLQNLRTSQILYERLEECHCPTQCEHVFYQLISTSTTMQFKSSFSMMSFGNFNVLDEYNLINIFFLSNRQTILVRDTITSTVYLLSSFGGVYSLFLGCSLITIAEIIYYGLFRFLLNLKLFGRINTDGKDISKRKTHEKLITYDTKYKNNLDRHIYNYNAFEY